MIDRIIMLTFIVSVFGCKSQITENVGKSLEPVIVETSVKSSSESKVVSEQKIQSKSLNSDKMSEITINEVMGQFDPAKHADFVAVESQYSDRNDRLMHREAYEAFQKMWEAAEADGIELKILSATRNFDYQKGIWERKWNGQRQVEGHALPDWLPNPVARARKILEYSSMPGTSRHHWGTDIDLNAFENDYFESGNGLKEYKWLQVHAGEFGFCQPYTKKDESRPNGYNEEKWHWSYIPVAKQFLEQAGSINDSMITGFDGSETAEQIRVVENYIFGINHRCKQ